MTAAIRIEHYQPRYREDFIRLNRKPGFREIPLDGHAYERCDILMEIYV